MKTSTPCNLRFFEKALQDALRRGVPALPLKLRCGMQQSALYILIQHPSTSSLSQQDYSVALDEALRQVLLQPNAKVPDLETLKTLRIYLYRSGQNRPYAGRTIALTKQSTGLSDLATHRAPNPVESNPVHLSTADHGAEVDAVEPKSVSSAAIALSPTEQSNMDGPAKLSTESTVAEPGIVQSETSVVPQRPSSIRIPFYHRRLDRRSKIFGAAAGLALAVLGVGSYGLTRPCVIGACATLSQAQQLSQTSEEMLQAAHSAEDVVVAYERLVEASYRLSKIPFWSKHYHQAQGLLANYQAEADLVAQIVVAQRQAREASLLTQNPPHPLEVWEDVRMKWQEAIVQLQSVPQDTLVANIAKTKLAEYQTNLVTINRRIRQEQDAQEKVAAARKAAQLAEAREGAAASSESWQLVHVTWQVVMNRLNDVPRDTMAYAEAQQLASIYESRLAASRDRLSREEVSASSYSQAIMLAEQAANYEQSGQWTQAVAHWQNALTHARQVPKETSYYDQVQPLINSYVEALNQAELHLNTAVAVEQARPLLEDVCHASSDLCTFTLTTEEIQVYVSAAYVDVIRRAMVSGGMTISTVDTDSALTKATGLLRAIAEVGILTQVPVGVYDAEGMLMGTYIPDLNGYIQPQTASSS